MNRTTRSERSLVLAPRGRDATVAIAILEEAGIDAEACASVPGMVGELETGAAFVIVTEEALATADLAPLVAWLKNQEEWSDLPFVLLTHQGGGLERNPSARRFLDLLGNVTFLERPFHPTTLVSLARSSLRNRRRQYEARGRLLALQEGEERYRSLFEAIDAGFCIIEMGFDDETEEPNDYRFVEVNPAFKQQTGLDNVEGRWMRELAPTHEKHWFETYGRVALTGEAKRFEQTAEALGRYYDVHAYRVGNPSQRRVAVLFNDITARRRVEDQLRESEDHYRHTVELNPQVTWTATPDGLLDNVAQRWFEWTGTSGVGATWALGLHEDDRERSLVGWRHSVETGQPYDIEHRVKMRDGEPRWARSRAYPRRNADGGIVKWYGTTQDIHEQKIAEASLRDLNAELEVQVAREVAERETAQEALRQSQKLEALGKLTGGVAHDFNNLLTPITGTLDLLQRRYAANDERAARLIDGALQSAERAKTLVQRLLGFARQQTLEARPVDIGELLDGMRDLIGSSVGQTIELQFASPARLPLALADPNQLELAILNLCVNARDAMPDGGTLSLALERVDVDAVNRLDLEPNAYLVLSVSDTGTGMDEQTLRRAVEPFFSTKEHGKGTGLGLSMVSGLMAQLGGGMDIESAPGKGTRISLYMPAVDSDERSMTVTAPRRVVGSTRPLAILLVDDEELVREGTAEMLRDMNHSVAQASGGAQALHLLSNGLQVDAVVSDYKMPGMDGAALAERVRAARPGLPILIITGFAGSDGNAAELPTLSKPFRQSELAAALDALMGAHA